MTFACDRFPIKINYQGCSYKGHQQRRSSHPIWVWRFGGPVDVEFLGPGAPPSSKGRPRTARIGVAASPEFSRWLL